MKRREFIAGLGARPYDPRNAVGHRRRGDPVKHRDPIRDISTVID